MDVYVYEPKGISSIQTKNTLGAHFADQIKVNSSTDKVTQMQCTDFNKHTVYAVNMIPIDSEAEESSFSPIYDTLL